MSSAIKIGIVLQRLAESPLKQHLILNAERLREWAASREEVVHVRRTRAASAAAAAACSLASSSSAFSRAARRSAASCCACSRSA